MNHDYEHCADFRDDCPKDCSRAELVRDLKAHPDVYAYRYTSWMHFGANLDCPRAKGEHIANHAK